MCNLSALLQNKRNKTKGMKGRIEGGGRREEGGGRREEKGVGNKRKQLVLFRLRHSRATYNWIELSIGSNTTRNLQFIDHVAKLGHILVVS